MRYTLKQVENDHFWACWWMFLIVLLVADDALTKWMDHREVMKEKP